MEFLKLLLDPARLAVVGAVALRPRTPDEAADHAGVDRRVALETIASLRQLHAVRETGDGRYHLDRDVLLELARRLPQPDPPDDAVFHGMTAAEQEVLGRFFVGNRLTEIPASRAKRLVVLERLALEFEPGRRYAEPEVNELLGRYHPDHASLRRHLVDEGLLDRDRGEYWRAGGRVVV